MDVVEEMRADAFAMAERIQRVMGRAGFWLAVSPGMLAATIRQYAEARRWSGPYEVRVIPPETIRSNPDGWTTHDEDVWLARLSDSITDDVWDTDVVTPVFGTDVRVWERNGPDWRHELLAYVPVWATRSFVIVEKHDPLPRPEEEAADEAAIAIEEAEGSGDLGGRRRRR